MRTHAELDAEIARENHAISKQEEPKRTKLEWRWLSPDERAERNEWIMELWAMGETREQIAEKVDLTPQRVSQVVNGFGAGWR